MLLVVKGRGPLTTGCRKSCSKDFVQPIIKGQGPLYYLGSQDLKLNMRNITWGSAPLILLPVIAAIGPTAQ